jgi:hypothetical protein
MENVNYCHTGQQWRFLKPGEVIQEGDRYARYRSCSREEVQPDLDDSLFGSGPEVGYIVQIQDEGTILRPVPPAEPVVTYTSSWDISCEDMQKLPVGAYGWIGQPAEEELEEENDFDLQAGAEVCRLDYVVAEMAAEKAIAYANLSLQQVSIRTGVDIRRLRYLFDEEYEELEELSPPDWLAESLSSDELVRIGQACGVYWHLVGLSTEDCLLTVVDTRPTEEEPTDKVEFGHPIPPSGDGIFLSGTDPSLDDYMFEDGDWFP